MYTLKLNGNTLMFKSSAPFQTSRIEIKRIGVRVVPNPGGSGAMYWWKDLPSSAPAEVVVLRAIKDRTLKELNVRLDPISADGFAVASSESTIRCLTEGAFYQVTADTPFFDTRFCFQRNGSFNLTASEMRAQLIELTRLTGRPALIDWKDDRGFRGYLWSFLPVASRKPTSQNP
jgi:hypothetical protein